MRCPRCGRTETGQVGTREYYCWNCCLEFHGAPGQWRLFTVDEEGQLLEVTETPEVPAPAETPPAPQVLA
jgi:hypothetical protein